MIGGVTRFKRLVLSPLNSTMFPPDSIVSFYSSLFTMEMWISKGKYDEFGPSIVHRKSF